MKAPSTEWKLRSEAHSTTFENICGGRSHLASLLMSVNKMKQLSTTFLPYVMIPSFPSVGNVASGKLSASPDLTFVEEALCPMYLLHVPQRAAPDRNRKHITQLFGERGHGTQASLRLRSKFGDSVPMIQRPPYRAGETGTTKMSEQRQSFSSGTSVGCGNKGHHIPSLWCSRLLLCKQVTSMEEIRRRKNFCHCKFHMTCES